MIQYLKNISVFIWNIFYRNEQKRLFIIGHMRSGSSLLMHILTSNSEILGWGERGLKYTAKNKMIENELTMRWKSMSLFKKYSFTLDQINHSEMTPIIDLFNNKNSYIVFLLREPIGSLSSIINLSKNYYHKEKSIKDASAYYTNRLNYLVNFKKGTPNAHHFMVTYDDLIENSLISLKSLTEFLELKEPLISEYEIKKITGISGDPSKNIKSGKIIKTKKELINIGQKIKSETTKTFKETVSDLNENN